MLPLIEAHRSQIAALCRDYGVRGLDVFGSAARETDFDPNRSDVDLLVIPVVPTDDWYARRVGVAAAREINEIPAGRPLEQESKVRPAGITYDPERPAPNLSEYFDLTDQLSALLGRPVDLVMSGAVRNPFVRADIDRWKQPIYAA